MEFDKHYLQDLKSWGLPIPESFFVNKNSNTVLKNIVEQKKWKHIVIKPTVSGAARHTYSLSDEIEIFKLNG